METYGSARFQKKTRLIPATRRSSSVSASVPCCQTPLSHDGGLFICNVVLGSKDLVSLDLSGCKLFSAGTLAYLPTRAPGFASWRHYAMSGNEIAYGRTRLTVPR
eukprot:1198821-Rhodomonas_salina.2